MQLNYRWLEYFWTVAREGSMTAAAYKLGVTQPTVSTLVAELEESLDQTLLERGPRNVTLTEAGSIVFRYAQEIFSLGKEMHSVLAGSSYDSLHPFRIGVANGIPKILAQRLIDPVFSSDINSHITCKSGSSESLLAELSTHEIDMVISDSQIPNNISVKAFNHPVLKCPISFVSTRSLAKRSKTEFPESIALIPMLLPSRGGAFRQSIDQWLEENDIKPSIRAEFEDTGIMKIAGSHKHGILPVPKVILKEVCLDYKLEHIGDLKGVNYELFIISTERRVSHPIVARMINLSS